MEVQQALRLGFPAGLLRRHQDRQDRPPEGQGERLRVGGTELSLADELGENGRLEGQRTFHGQFAQQPRGLRGAVLLEGEHAPRGDDSRVVQPDVQESGRGGSQLFEGDHLVDGHRILRVTQRHAETPRHRHQAFVDARQHRVEHGLFAAEMVVDGTLLDAHRSGEIAHGGARESVDGETLLCDVQQGGSGVATHESTPGLWMRFRHWQFLRRSPVRAAPKGRSHTTFV